MEKQAQQIAVIGLGLGAMMLLAKGKVNGGGSTVITHQVPGQSSGSTVGKLYDSYGERTGGRVDRYWGEIVPKKSYLGREADLRGYYLDPHKAIEHFNLHGIEFGNWMNQEDRVNFMYATLVSLADIAKVLNVPQSAMGLNQRLQLAFGARGKGGFAAAFYMPSPTAVINLTKTMGKGTFAHEFGHALDEHARLIETGKRGLMSGRTTSRTTNPGLYPKESTAYLFEKVFETLYWKEDGSPTAFYNAQTKRSKYYNMRAEVWARTFERYCEIKFEEAGIVNRWALDPDGFQPPRDLVLKAAPWIQKIVRRAFSPSNRTAKVGAIFPEVPGAFYECADGTFTERNGRRACSWHGGLKSGEAITTGGGSGFVQDVPLSKIHENTELFQNRANAYSTRSVEAIVSAVIEGRFVWSNLDPIQLWKGPDGKLYILSGHSRTEAFKRLAAMNTIYQGRSFDTIPAKVETNLSLAEAQKVARESNTLSTPETALERAAYYRRLRKTGEFTLRQLEEQAKLTEGRNANKVLAFSFLNVGGKTYNALESLQTADTTSFANIETVGQWIGNARKTLPMLSNSHENELYDWLVSGGGYGTKSGQINSESAFKNELQKIIHRRTEFGNFNQNEPLNIQNSRYALPAEAEFNAQVAELQKAISDLEKEKKEKLRRYANEATASEMQRILAPIEAGLRIKGQELQRLILKKVEILDAAKNQGSLFGIRRWRQRA